MNKRNRHHPPRIGEKLFRLILPESEWRTLLGDYEELYEDLVDEKGKIIATLWYWFQILITFTSVFCDSMKWSVIMIGNYLKITLRNLKKHRGYSFINITGLAVGMACSILILLWIQDEMSYDTFHENADELYVVGTHNSDGDRVFTSTSTPTALGPALKEEYPEILDYVRFANGNLPYVLSTGEKRFNERVRIADPAVLDMFTFPLQKGEPATALSDPHSVVMTENMAKKYFGDEDPIGKTVRVNNEYDFMVTGILQEIPHNSSLRFDFLLPLGFLEEDWNVNLNKWTNFAWATYVLLDKKAKLNELNQKIEGRINQESIHDDVKTFLSPYTRLHLHYLGYGGGNIGQVLIFGIIALLVLLIACINFMNLTTARSGNRAREIGMRKVAGAYKKDIIKQFYGESVMFSFISLLCAVGLVLLLLPTFNNLTEKQLTLSVYSHPVLFFLLIGVALFTAFIAGSYPALFMSTFQPVRILKGSFGSESKSSRYRKVLVVTQFTVSIVLIVMTMVVYEQLNYMHDRNPGFNKERLLYIRLNRNLKQHFEAAKQEMLQKTGIISVSGVSSPMTTVWDSGNDYDWEGKNPAVNPSVRRLSVDFDFLKAFEIEMARGSFYSREFTKGSSDICGQVVINETFANIIGLEDPVGTRLSDGPLHYTIIGVVKDFNFTSLYREIGPLIIYHKIENSVHGLNRFRFMFLKIHPDNIPRTIAHIEEVYKRFNPELPFEYRFLEDDFDLLYRSEQRVGSIIRYFAALTILISCLGLFGLASFTAEQRTKEIGIRKILGSSVRGIVLLLSLEFVRWVAIANLIAWPLAWLISKGWLKNFAYQTGIGWNIFFLTGLLTVMIALVTVSYQAVRAARTNPVDSLRYE